MSHQPFESWLLSDEPLDEEQQENLQAHLMECETCRTLSEALIQVEEAIVSHPTPSPESGFVQRWHGRLSIARQQRQQRKMWFLTLGLFGAAGLILMSVFLLNINRINWFYEIGQAFANFIRVANRINQAINLISTLTNQFPILIPIMVIFSIGSISALFALFVTWVSSIIRLYQPQHKGVPVR